MTEVLDIFKSDSNLVRIVAAAAVLMLFYFAGSVVRLLEKKVLRKLLERTSTALDNSLVRLLASPARIIIRILGLYLALQIVRPMLPGHIPAVADGIIYILIVLVIARTFIAALQAILEWQMTRRPRGEARALQKDFGPLFKRIISIIFYMVALVMILRHFGQDISSLVVSLGVGSLAVALAARDTLANMIAGFMIMSDRPFRIGDRIVLESGQKGDVFDIGLRTTKIKTFDNTLIIVPNNQIINEKVTNLSYPDPQIRVVVEVGVAYGSDLRRVKTLLEGVCRSHTDVIENPPPAIYFVNFGNSSLDFQVTCRIAEWSMQWRVAEELRLSIYECFEREGIEIPFPQRVVTMRQDKDTAGGK